MLILVDQVKKRTEYLHGYLDQLSTSINRKKYQEALSFISNQKSNINHTNVSNYNPHAFLIDSLKTKNEKLSLTLQELLKEQQLLKSSIDTLNKNSGGIENPLIVQKVPTIVSKIPFTLKDIRKLQLEPMSIRTNYQTLTITTYQSKEYTISHNKIFFIDRKNSLINFNAHLQHVTDRNHVEKDHVNLYVAIKFSDEVSANNWYSALSFGKMVSEAKGNRYLFIEKNHRLDDVEPLVGSKDASDNKMLEESQVTAYANHVQNVSGFRSTFMPQNSQKNNKPSMYTSAINQKTSPTIPDNPFYQPHRHLTASLINDPTKKPLNYSTYRPTPLNRVRGKSMFLEFNTGKNPYQYKNQKEDDYMNEQMNFFEQKNHLKSSSKNNFRKASEDITLRAKNQSSQQKKLQKFRSQRNLMDEILTHQNYRQQKTSKQPYNSQINSGISQSNSKRIDAQIEKKNELIERSNRLLDRALTNNSLKSQQNLRQNIRWVKQNDENLSRSSHQTNSKQPSHHAKFKQEAEYRLDDPLNMAHHNKQDFNEDIEQASQAHEISPTLPKKIVYEDGSNIRLYPVENTIPARPKANSKATSQYESQQQQDISPLEQHYQNQGSQARHIRNQRLNTLDSQTEKQHEMHESNSEDHEEEEFEQLLDELKKGLVLTKCAEGSFWTREKQIKLSENQNTLLIIDVKDKKIKKIPISDIITVEYGKFSKGIIKHVQQIQEKKCLMLSVQQGKQSKKIEFMGNNPQKLLVFANNLNYYVETFKSS